ncbi:GNAT family N-acetyltransferase [Zhihengliuella halotolerans]|uniref:Acetyltransferase (GNAT) family protein n=1 Tax=Zhihengliuella halotolerans TaxID=370736 RepID=A0A4Q8AA32_9MICC|nr:GNAT family N-acetyltransferase [Zhihengliuella halotolerans]RZU60952.1 acetyltransferase (GNAT) family protein [Zhihengliuella halotolerans]
MSTTADFDVRAATTGDLETASGVLALAFAKYPWTRWSIPEDDFSRRLAGLQELYLSYALSAGVVLVEDQVHGVIALLPPDAPAPSEDFQGRVAELHGDRLDAVARACLPPAPDDHWTLATVGVRPERQGTGLGAALIRAGLDVVEATGGAGVALETSSDANVRLYERFGFVVTATSWIDQGPVVHSMVLGGGTGMATAEADEGAALSSGAMPRAT